MKEKDKNIYMLGYSIDEWHKLADKYFDAETTEDEEKMLSLFLTSSYCPDKEFDDIKAVMGFLVSGKRKYKKHSVLKTYRWIAAAMITLVIGTTAWKFIEDRNNVCIAYISGNKCTDSDEVMKQMRISIDDVNSSEVDNTIDEQMKDIFGTLDNN